MITIPTLINNINNKGCTCAVEECLFVGNGMFVCWGFDFEEECKSSMDVNEGVEYLLLVAKRLYCMFYVSFWPLSGQPGMKGQEAKWLGAKLWIEAGRGYAWLRATGLLMVLGEVRCNDERSSQVYPSFVDPSQMSYNLEG